MKPDSHTSHPVYREGDFWLKSWTPGDELKAEGLRREHRLNLALGRDSRLDERGVRTPHEGEHPAHWSPELMRGVLRAQQGLLVGYPLLEDLRDVATWGADQRRMIEARLPEGEQRDRCLSLLPAGPVPEVTPATAEDPVLVHSDPHLRNIVLDEWAEPSFIDWEAGVRAPESAARAYLAHYVLLDARDHDRAEMVEELREYARHPRLFDWVLATRQASWTSWMLVNRGEAETNIAVLRTRL